MSSCIARQIDCGEFYAELRLIPSEGKLCRVYEVHGKQACHFEDYPSDLEALEDCPVWSREYKKIYVKEAAYAILFFIALVIAVVSISLNVYQARILNRVVTRLVIAERLPIPEDERPIIRWRENWRIARDRGGWGRQRLRNEEDGRASAASGGTGGGGGASGGADGATASSTAANHSFRDVDLHA
jgi:hypothetical protein